MTVDETLRALAALLPDDSAVRHLREKLSRELGFDYHEEIDIELEVPEGE